MGWSIVGRTQGSGKELCDPERQASKRQENW